MHILYDTQCCGRLEDIVEKIIHARKGMNINETFTYCDRLGHFKETNTGNNRESGVFSGPCCVVPYHAVPCHTALSVR
jgi:hypothetical protein